ncbi:LETM1-like protein [Trifolium pratense]|uniref:LETM1-like protein n=1 Tax=Trifolium pratense TaxID=57577 RepID=A0A2K3P4Z8_TRIPR|nr:LETM1-like protein [Trifolium pratense]
MLLEWIDKHQAEDDLEENKNLIYQQPALKSVEEAVIKLENLLQELHVSSSSSGKEHLKAACSDLEKIRKLKKEAEFLEASFRAKADSLQEGVNSAQTIKPVGEEDRLIKGKNRNDNVRVDRSKRQIGKSRGFWGIFVPPVNRKPDLEPDVDSYNNCRCSFAASRKHGHCNPVSGGMNFSMTLPPSLGSHIRCHFMQPSLRQGT